MSADGRADARADAAPIIVTLQLDGATSETFERLRQTYFPPELNRVPAHLTLFHALPGAQVDRVLRVVGHSALARPPFPVRVTGLLKLGRGVGFRLEAPTLTAVRREIQEAFAERLTRQDREGFRPHVTVQNKVSPERARHTYEALMAGFSPWEATAEGLQLWHYRGGPWEPLAVVPFGR